MNYRHDNFRDNARVDEMAKQEEGGLNVENDHNRLSIVMDIVSFARPVAEMEKDITSYPWDYSGKGVTLTAKNISHALDMYKFGVITDKDLVDWANLIELREDIVYDAERHDAIEQAIFVLANPEINCQISYEIVENIKISLQ